MQNEGIRTFTRAQAVHPGLLVRRTSHDGVVYYSSPLLERYKIPHAFSTRIGGVSPAPFDSMNLGNPNGCAMQDDTDHIAENYRRLMQAIGCEHLPRYYLHQIHGDLVSVVDRDDFSNSTKGDALVTAHPNSVLSVRIADCCPVLLATPDGRAVAAIHAGWRGAVGGVIPAAIAKLRSVAGAEPRDLLAAIGPCIGFDAFEVGPEVLVEFERVFGSDASVRHDGNGKGHVDLPSACKMQLLRAGVQIETIDTTACCTFRDVEEFFSHRRDHGVTGRMSALIASLLT
jgi:YfiH family protein